MANDLKVILGLTGMFCAGKGEVASYLVQKHGFVAASFSDPMREAIRQSGQEVTRERLQSLAGEWRQEYGPNVLAEKTLEYVRSKGAEKAVVETIRSVEEVNFLRIQPNFYLVSVEADGKIRFERMKARHREEDPQTWEEFVASEERDNHKEGRNIDAAMAMADYVLENSNTEEELHQKIDELLKKLS